MEGGAGPRFTYSNLGRLLDDVNLRPLRSMLVEYSLVNLDSMRAAGEATLRATLGDLGAPRPAPLAPFYSAPAPSYPSPRPGPAKPR